MLILVVPTELSVYLVRDTTSATPKRELKTPRNSRSRPAVGERDARPTDQRVSDWQRDTCPSGRISYPINLIKKGLRSLDVTTVAKSRLLLRY